MTQSHETPILPKGLESPLTRMEQVALNSIRRRFPGMDYKILEVVQELTHHYTREIQVGFVVYRSIRGWHGKLCVFAPGFLDPVRQHWPVVSPELEGTEKYDAAPYEWGGKHSMAHPYPSRDECEQACERQAEIMRKQFAELADATSFQESK